MGSMDDEKPIFEYDHLPGKRGRSALEIVIITVVGLILLFVAVGVYIRTFTPELP
jgi:hypothetical protein